MTDGEKYVCVLGLLDLHQNGELSPLAFVVGVALIEATRPDGSCPITRQQIADRIGRSRIPTISQKLGELRRAGWLLSPTVTENDTVDSRGVEAVVSPEREI